MPVLSTAWLHNLTERTATNDTVQALQVVCAWPVSGQYGPGSRILYYVLIAACIFARKAEWLRNACLAAALLFPAVAAIHAIVLAAVRVDGAVDMDLYGVFQLMSIGILTAPVTVRLSRTYFYDPGRNTIFLWTGLILAGLLSLTVSFFGIETSSCLLDNNGIPVSTNRDDFPYGTTCGLFCSPDHGPHSPLREGSANDINVIPTPHILTFGMGTLFAAGCCIPAILSLVFMWTKILEINWRNRFGDETTGLKVQEPIEGTNGATIETMTRVNKMVRGFLSAVEVPIFGAAILAILIIGERNFFSRSMRYETEPLATIGQWAPIVGASLAVIGSLYLVLAADIEAVEHEQEIFSNASLHPNSPAPSIGRTQSPMSLRPGRSRDRTTRNVVVSDDEHELVTNPTPDVGHRRRVARKLTVIGDRLGNAAHEHFDVSGFKVGPATGFPEIPGEKLRNPELGNIERSWTPTPSDGKITPGLQRQNSRGSLVSVSGLGISLAPSISRAHSTSTSHSLDPKAESSTVQHVERIYLDGVQRPLPSTDQRRGRTRVRSDTLQVPSSASQSATVIARPFSLVNEVQVGQELQRPPSIVISKEPADNA